MGQPALSQNGLVWVQVRSLELLIAGKGRTSHIFMQQFVLHGHYLSKRVVSTCCGPKVGTGPAGSAAEIRNASDERGRFI